MPSANIVVTAVAWLLACGMAAAVSAQSRQGSQQSARIRLHGQAQMVVEDAVSGAFRRLSTATCQLVLQDFRDASARPLETRLEVLDQTVAEYLASMYFVDGDDSTQCRLNDATAAFTEPGSRVIHVCAKKFAMQFARRTAGGEILVSHELLHSLGSDSWRRVSTIARSNASERRWTAPLRKPDHGEADMLPYVRSSPATRARHL